MIFPFHTWNSPSLLFDSHLCMAQKQQTPEFGVLWHKKFSSLYALLTARSARIKSQLAGWNRITMFGSRETDGGGGE